MNSYEDNMKKISRNETKINILEYEKDKNNSRYNTVARICKSSAISSCAAMSMVVISPFIPDMSILMPLGILGVTSSAYFVSLMSCIKIDNRKQEIFKKITELEFDNIRLNDEIKELYIINKEKEINNNYNIEENNIEIQNNNVNKVKVLSLTKNNSK